MFQATRFDYIQREKNHHHIRINSNSAIVLLSEIERKYDSDKIISPEVKLEHIMPKNKTQWLSYIIENHGDIQNEDQAKEFRKERINWIGNQTLVNDSKNIKKHSFASKQDIYRNESYKITSDLANENKWSKMEIEKRQKQFEDMLFDIIDLTKFGDAKSQ